MTMNGSEHPVKCSNKRVEDVAHPPLSGCGPVVVTVAARFLRMASIPDEDLVVLVLTDPSAIEEKLTPDDMSISTLDITEWNLPLILSARVVKVEAHRSRLIDRSSYFRGLLGGRFSESSLDHIVVQWNLDIIVCVLRFIYGLLAYVTQNNFVRLLEGALFFGVEGLLLECESWFHKFMSSSETYESEGSLDAIIEIWNFVVEHGIRSVQDSCKDYLPRKFEWAISCSAFASIPYELLLSCIEHPDLTISSERQLCEALLSWLSSRAEFSGCSSFNSWNNYEDLLMKVRICLLPLKFAAGQRREFTRFADDCVNTILFLMKNYSTCLRRAVTDGNFHKYRIRLTKYSEKIVLSDCPQMTASFLFLALLPLDLDADLKVAVENALVEVDRGTGNDEIIGRSLSTSSFEAVREVDISRCPKLHFPDAVKWLCMAFPSLRILRAAQAFDFRMDYLAYLLRKNCLIQEVDVAADISPHVFTNMSTSSASTERNKISKITQNISSAGIAYFQLGRPLSNITKLTLEGRTDINDLDFLSISLSSLSCLNIKGCIRVTDMAISKVISECINITSLIVSYTSFGRNSVLALCSDSVSLNAHSGAHLGHTLSGMVAFKLQNLQIDGCEGVDQELMSLLMIHLFMLKVLSLKETCLFDDALCNFKGSSLESLDVSGTMVSMQALSFIVGRNPDMRCLKARGCRNLQQLGSCNRISDEGTSHGDLFSELRKKCLLEEVAFGWGFSSAALQKLHTTLRKLRAISLGLGTSLDHHALRRLPTLCPLLESMILSFQIVSDDIVRSFLESFKHLQVFALSYCIGDLTSFSFQIGMPMLRVLRLEWIAPWMTNDDLHVLTQNCPKLVELSLSGCKLLDSDSQKIVSSGWPGLTLLHLEECGQITAHGVSSFFDCKAIEDLLLRHSGQGIGMNFIAVAASKFPLLRKLGLDLCDACDGEFERLPEHTKSYFLSNVRISCCTSLRCGFELKGIRRKAVKKIHKETIVLAWNRRRLTTQVVKERI